MPNRRGWFPYGGKLHLMQARELPLSEGRHRLKNTGPVRPGPLKAFVNSGVYLTVILRI